MQKNRAVDGGFIAVLQVFWWMVDFDFWIRKNVACFENFGLECMMQWSTCPLIGL
jgi:hypothetical protein